MPSVEDARPGQCPACQAASREPGKHLGLHGHGLRERQVWGPVVLGGPPEELGVLLRRYLCRQCSAVITVGPLGLMPGWIYSAPAIGWALALFGLARLSAAEVRRRVSPWSAVGACAAAGWASLKRWARAVAGRRLFSFVRPCPPGWTPRQVAGRVGERLAALSMEPSGSLSLSHHAWHGAAQIGRATTI